MNSKKSARKPRRKSYVVTKKFRFFVVDEYIEGNVGDVIQILPYHEVHLTNYLQEK